MTKTKDLVQRMSRKRVVVGMRSIEETESVNSEEQPVSKQSVQSIVKEMRE